MGSYLSAMNQEGASTPREPFFPTEQDFKSVEDLLVHAVPLEIAQVILDEAEYWPSVLSKHSWESPKEVAASWQVGYNSTECCFISPRVPGALVDGCQARVKKVEFHLESNDQGWGGETGLTGEYAGSYTWFEAAIIRGLGGDEEIEDPAKTSRLIQGSSTRPTDEDATDPILPGAFQVANPAVHNSKVWHLQKNRRASKEKKLHKIVWTRGEDNEKKVDTNETLDKSGQGCGSGFVYELAEGDRITIYARAQYPGWANFIHELQVQVYYSL